MQMLKAISTTKDTEHRSGVTLTEVLMSLMIMAIGVTSVMTLFPIATLRSAQATRLTNSALLKYNVEALLDARPELIFDPDGDGNLAEHFRGAARNYIVDPLGYFSSLEYAGGGAAGAAIASTFGNDGTGAHANGLPRFDGGNLFRYSLDPTTLTNDQLRALRLLGAKDSQLGDTWDTQFDFFIEDATTDLIRDGNNEVVAIRIPADVIPDAEALSLVQTSATEIPTTVTMVDPEVHRITVFSADGQLSQSYPLLVVNAAREATWSESIVGVDVDRSGQIENRPIPREFQGTIGRVLIQSKRSADFTWMLSVRRAADGQARNVDVIVRFGERLKLADEYLYPYLPVDPTPGVLRNVAGTSVAVVQLPTGFEPALKRGGYMFDVANALWYRIREFEVDEGAGIFSVMLEKPASKSFTGGAIFLPGIIDVYPMGSRNLP